MANPGLESAPVSISAQESPIAPRVRQLLSRAVTVNATDIHIDPSTTGFRIRLRVDGAIQHHADLSQEEGAELVNLVKVAGGFTPDRTVVAQEGRIYFEQEADGQGTEIRVTIAPTVNTEAVHLRLLAPPAEVLTSGELGLSAHSLEAVHDVLSANEGLVLIAGHTGAGKTMTLYSMVSTLNAESRMICSIEDPVEYVLDGVRQMQVDAQNELWMSLGLRTLLRMDPDVMVVGEIRDADSAVSAVRAAASGRLVLGTVHARDAALAVDMLEYYQVPPKLLGNTLELVICQDLIRLLCPHCGRSRSLTEEERNAFDSVGMAPPEEVRTAGGCDTCFGFGYAGRTGVFEVSPISEHLGSRIGEGVRGPELRRMVQDRNIQTLEQSALQAVAEGLTSMTEAMNVFRRSQNSPNVADTVYSGLPSSSQ